MIYFEKCLNNALTRLPLALFSLYLLSLMLAAGQQNVHVWLVSNEKCNHTLALWTAMLCKYKQKFSINRKKRKHILLLLFIWTSLT